MRPPPTPPNTPPPEPGRVLPLWETSDGWHILSLGWWNVPGYDYEDACRGQSDDDIERELNLSWSHRKGKSVYKEFGRGRHVALERIEYDPSRPLHIGWDWATQPTMVVTQLNAYRQWCILSCLQVDEDESMGLYDFVTWVAEHLYEKYAEPHKKSLEELAMVHIGDPSGSARPPRVGEVQPKLGSPRETRSAFEILRDGVELFMGYDGNGDPVYERRAGFGWQVIPGEVALIHRLEGVRARLRLSLDAGVPALVVDPECHLVIDALGGGYHYHQRSDGRYEDDPYKDWAADVADALGYVTTKLFVRPEKPDDWRDVEEYRSQAASNRR